MAALCNRGPLYFCPVVSFYLSSIFFFYSSPNLSGRRLDVYHTLTQCHSANLECRSERCCTRLAANAGPKKVAKKPSGHHLTTLSGYIFATKACIDNRKKNLLCSNISPTCPYNMVNFGKLAAEIVSLVWGPQVISTCFVSWQRYCTAL